MNTIDWFGKLFQDILSIKIVGSNELYIIFIIIIITIIIIIIISSSVSIQYTILVRDFFTHISSINKKRLNLKLIYSCCLRSFEKNDVPRASKCLNRIPYSDDDNSTPKSCVTTYIFYYLYSLWYTKKMYRFVFQNWDLNA